MIRSHLIVPDFLCRGQPLVKILEPLLEVRGVLRIQFSQFIGDPMRHSAAIIGIEPVMRIAERMDVAHGARDLPSRLSSTSANRLVEASRYAAALLDPADFRSG